MSSTSLFVAILLCHIGASIVLWAWFLRMGLRWAKVEGRTMWQALRTATIVFILHVLLSCLFLSITTSSMGQAILLGLTELAAAIVVPCAVIRVVFKVPFLKACQAWIPTLLANITTLAIALFVLQPFLYKAYFVSSNAMAPTILGQHWKGICPLCGSSRYCSPKDERYGGNEEPIMTCERFHVTSGTDIDRTVHQGDRVVIAKFLTPQRWDLIIFRFPEAPETLYVKRLVGLPGEKIHLQDGSLWINGQRQTPPEALRELEYLQEIPNWKGPEAWGAKNRPVLLGEDEFFVLGDFSAQSMDSRFWSRGAPGHNPYAVPQSYIEGVVTLTFWPIQRWRSHR